MRVIQGANKHHVATVEGGGTTVNTSTTTKLDYDGIAIDQTGIYDTGNARYYAPETGLYFVHATVRCPGPGSDGRHDMAVRINGSTYLSEGRNQQGANDAGCSVTGIVPLSAGQYVDVVYNYNSTASSISTTASSNISGSFTLGTTSLHVFMIAKR